MQNKETVISLSTLLFLIFLTLKLTEVGVVSDWSWIWVFSPFWIPILLVILAYPLVWLISQITIVGFELYYRYIASEENFKSFLKSKQIIEEREKKSKKNIIQKIQEADKIQRKRNNGKNKYRGRS